MNKRTPNSPKIKMTAKPRPRSPWDSPPSVYRSFERSLLQIVREMLSELLDEGWDLYSAVPEFDWLQELASRAAERMVTQVLVTSQKTWRQAAAKSSSGSLIRKSLSQELQGPVGSRYRQLVSESARLISSLPGDAAKLVAVRAARRGLEHGERALSDWSLLGRIARARARLISRTQVSVATSALTQSRCDLLGLDWYVWETSRDERVRRSHRLMQGVICRWSHPPAPEALAHEKSRLGHYQAGNCPNDRCFPAPLLHLQDVQWPRKVCPDGDRILTMGLAEFRNRFHYEGFKFQSPQAA